MSCHVHAPDGDSGSHARRVTALQRLDPAVPLCQVSKCRLAFSANHQLQGIPLRGHLLREEDLPVLVIYGVKITLSLGTGMIAASSLRILSLSNTGSRNLLRAARVCSANSVSRVRWLPGRPDHTRGQACLQWARPATSWGARSATGRLQTSSVRYTGPQTGCQCRVLNLSAVMASGQICRPVYAVAIALQ